MDEPYTCLHLVYILASFPSTVELLDAVFFLGSDLSLLQNDANIYIPVFSLMDGTNFYISTILYPQDRSNHIILLDGFNQFIFFFNIMNRQQIISLRHFKSSNFKKCLTLFLYFVPTLPVHLIIVLTPPKFF